MSRQITVGVSEFRKSAPLVPFISTEADKSKD